MYIERYLDAVKDVHYNNDKTCSRMVAELLQLFLKVKTQHNIVYFVGNGGSAGISIHMTADFLKNGKMRVHSMHEPATLTCLGNDFGFEFVFSKQLEIVANSNDLLVAISSSGNSPNIVNAAKIAKERGCQVLTFTGFHPDNQLRQLGDYNVYVPSMEYGIVESVHNMILQRLVDGIVAQENKEM